MFKTFKGCCHIFKLKLRFANQVLQTVKTKNPNYRSVVNIN